MECEIVLLILRRITRQKRIDVVTVEQLHREDTLRRKLPVNAWYNDAIFFVKQRPRLFQMASLAGVVGFLLDAATQEIDLRFQVFPVMGQARRQQHRNQISEIRANRFRNPRVLNLDRHFLTRLQPRSMHLTE